MTKTPQWPDWLEDCIWAKSREKAVEGQAESLARHTWCVLERLAETIRLRPGLPKSLHFAELWNCLFWACFLHDFGKAARGFQERLCGGARWPHRHEVLSLAFLDWISSALSEDGLKWVAAAIVSHHKDADEILLLYMDPSDPAEDPLAERLGEIDDEIAAGLWRWLKECSASWIEELGLADAGIRVPTLPPLEEAVRGIGRQGAERTRHWLQTYRRWMKELKRSDQHSLVVGTLALRGYLVSADHMASARTGTLPEPLLSRAGALLDRLRMDEAGLYAHQKTCASTRGSAVLVAPTGSGKTESALLWATAQVNEAALVPRLFYTLPYQASMNAMYDRLNGGAFPGQVGLEHGRAALALYRHWLEEDYTPEQATRAARWGRELARLNYFPVRILSPYQVLKAPYRLKGYEALLSDFFDATFILDEVHAYEPSRLAMILGTTKYLRENFGAKFFVMSATLPNLLRRRLAEALGEHSWIRATPELFARFRRHRLELVEGDLLSDSRMSEVAEEARRGQSILVCCNTVKRSQQVYQEVKSRLRGECEAILLHGRFNGMDRLAKEESVRVATGVRSAERKPIVLVATQVVEVSLDIDLDVIYTDPAPLEALIQRFGRINRRRLKEWAPVRVFTMPEDGQGVYEDELVRASLAVLAGNAGRMVDEECISDWLDQVYDGQVAAKWHRLYLQACEDFEGACLRTLRAFNSSPELEEQFNRAFDSVEVLPLSLEPEYRASVEHRPLEATQLLVPLRWGQFARLRSEGKARNSDLPGWPKVVDAPYSSDLGLEV